MLQLVSGIIHFIFHMLALVSLFSQLLINLINN